MADILNSIIHSSDNAIGGLYNAMRIRRQKEQDTRNAMVQDRNFDEDIKAQTWERAQQMALGGAPDEEILGLFNSVSQQRGWAPADPGVIPQVRASAQGSVYGKSAQGGGIGQYNPRDYTPATWAKFVQTGDPSVLARYEPFRPTKIGGVDGMADVVTGQFIPGVMAGPDGTQTPIDLNMVAGNQGAIAGSIADARNASDTAAIPMQTPLLAEQERQQTAAREGAITAEIPKRAAVKAPADASVASLVTTATKQAEFSASAANEAFSSLNKIRAATANIDDAIAAIDSGAESGPVMSLLPSVQTASVELDNIQGKMGLDVIGATTFGALSKDERLFALDVALPNKLSPPELRAWLKRKKDAQLKMVAQLENAAIFLSKPGNTPAMYLEKLNTSVDLPVGTVRRGYIYQGGDPSKQESWKKQ